MTQRDSAVDAHAHLRPVSGRPPVREYLRQLVERRHFIVMQAWVQTTHRNRGMLLGNLWLILAPVMDGLVYFLIFGAVVGAGGKIPNFFGYLVIGIFMFTFTSRCLTAAVVAIPNNRGLIGAFAFPRASLPIAVTLRETFATVPVVATMLILIYAVPPHALPRPAWWLIPFMMLLHAAFNMGLGFIIARIGAALPDVRQIIPYVVRFWLYGSAVVFAAERFDSIPFLGSIVRANPMYLILDMYRQVLLNGSVPSPTAWATITAWSLGLLVSGTLVFWQAEVSYGRR